MSKQQHILDVRNLSVGYSGHIVLQNVNFNLEHGEILAIIGQNGSGKSTLLKTVCGLLPKKAGEIFHNGHRQNDIEPHKLTRIGLSYFAQGGLIMPTLTVREHLELAGSHQHANQNESLLEEVLSEFPSLRPIQKKLAGNLSGGERKMLSLAVLIMQGTTTWILDEPTAGLSPSMVLFMADFLLKKNREGITVLLVEHNTEVVLNIASHIVATKDDTITMKFDKKVFLQKDFLNKLIFN